MTTSSPGPEGFGRPLREFRLLRRLTQADVAGELGVQRATLSQWETGKHLPSTDNAQRLDEMLGADGSLLSLLDAARTAAEDPAPDGVPSDPERLSLRDVYDRLGRELVSRLVHDGSGRPLGWRHDLASEYTPTPLSTALALKTLLLLDGPPVDLHALGEVLLAERDPSSGGWSAGRARARPEATVLIVETLTRIGARVSTDELLQSLESLLTPTARRRTYVLTSVLEVLARLRPSSPLTGRVVDMLLATRGTNSDVALWPEKVPNPAQAAVAALLPEPSIPHTARSVIALAPFRDRPAVADAVDEAVEWLGRRPSGILARENLSPVEDGQRRDLEIRHFTPALVARALASAPQPPWSLVATALDEVWSHYRATLGLWAWPNLDVPVWLQLDAVLATRLATERRSFPPMRATSPPRQPPTET